MGRINLTVYGRSQPSSKTAFVITVTTHRLPACNPPPNSERRPKPGHSTFWLYWQHHTHTKRTNKEGKKKTHLIFPSLPQDQKCTGKASIPVRSHILNHSNPARLLGPGEYGSLEQSDNLALGQPEGQFSDKHQAVRGSCEPRTKQQLRCPSLQPSTSEIPATLQ